MLQRERFMKNLFDKADNYEHLINEKKYDKNNIIYVSVASIWEIEIKHIKKAESMPYDAKSILRSIECSDFELIDIKKDYILELQSIINQNIHSDPFDHILLSMAKNDNLTLVTHDSNMKDYKDVGIISY